MVSQKEKRRRELLVMIFSHIRNPPSCPYVEPPVHMEAATLGAGKIGQLFIVNHAKAHHGRRTI